MHRNTHSYAKVITCKYPQVKKTFKSTSVLAINTDVFSTIRLTCRFINIQ